MAAQGKLGTALASLFVILTGATVLIATATTRVSPVHAAIGPRIFPYAFGAILLLLGLLLVRNAWRGHWTCEATDPAEPAPDLTAMAWVVGALVLNLVLIKPVGFILSSTLMYVLIAKGFGARRLWFAAVCGFVLAALAYFGFAGLLGLRMGGGLIEDLF